MFTVINLTNFQILFPLYIFSGSAPDIFCALLQERTALLRSDNFLFFTDPKQSSVLVCFSNVSTLIVNSRF